MTDLTARLRVSADMISDENDDFAKELIEAAERLALLLEEMGEAQHAIGKILRHGYESVNPDEHAGPTNRRSLENELGDIKHAMERMILVGDLNARIINRGADDKKVRVGRYLHHQDQAND